ncbi:hypothetical protein SRHO_G00256570 [Serrasalmus rhombeus]
MRSPAIKTVAPPGPFRHLQVDYITLPKCEGKQDVLVIVDKFSRWIECYPTSKGTAAHTAKMLVQDFIPRWGLPEQIESDQGTHFTGQVVQAVCKLLKVNWKLHCPYRPQASGQVERVNRVIKERLTKLHSQGVKWTAALPAVLCSIRATSNKTVGLSPYEVVTGRPMLVPGVIDLRKADVHLLTTQQRRCPHPLRTLHGLLDALSTLQEMCISRKSAQLIGDEDETLKTTYQATDAVKFTRTT